jgi:glycosyltransferase involved in cell wall biosynthesis
MSEKALSVCMIVRNEAAILSRCLDSVRTLTPEILIVDTGSTDATAHVARSYGATVELFDFNTVHFGAARNRALELANGRWILVLDADEVLDPGSVPLIQQIIAANENAGYYFERVNIQAGSDRPKSDYVVRLFPNHREYRYRGRVHETIDGSILAAGGRLLRSKIRIEHDFASDAKARRRKNLWYIEILNQEILDDPSDSGRLDFLAAEYHQLGRFDAAMEVAERILTFRPRDPEAHLRAGIYHLLHKIDREQARRDFSEALRLRPGYTEAVSFLQLLSQPE